MNKTFYILFFVWASILCDAQVNLVTNPSFEDTLYCPLGADIYSCQGWTTPTDATPDYFNPCANTINYGAPFNGFGYEFAHSGSSYAGFVPYTGGVVINGSSYREYIQNKLLSTLESSSLYKVSFYVSLGDSGIYASNNIGVYFSNTNFYYSNVGNLPFIPSCNENDIITKNAGWQFVEYYYLASGNENYITIGNFYNDSFTSSSLITGNNHNDPYYYIDDVSVEKTDLVLPNIFTPNNDGINDEWIMGSLSANIQIQIYNQWGRLVSSGVALDYSWDGRNIAGVECADGVYYYIVSFKDKAGIVSKGFIQLIR